MTGIRPPTSRGARSRIRQWIRCRLPAGLWRPVVPVREFYHQGRRRRLELDGHHTRRRIAAAQGATPNRSRVSAPLRVAGHMYSACLLGGHGYGACAADGAAMRLLTCCGGPFRVTNAAGAFCPPRLGQPTASMDLLGSAALLGEPAVDHRISGDTRSYSLLHRGATVRVLVASRNGWLVASCRVQFIVMTARRGGHPPVRPALRRAGRYHPFCGASFCPSVLPPPTHPAWWQFCPRSGPANPSYSRAPGSDRTQCSSGCARRRFQPPVQADTPAATRSRISPAWVPAAPSGTALIGGSGSWVPFAVPTGPTMSAHCHRRRSKLTARSCCW